MINDNTPVILIAGITRNHAIGKEGKLVVNSKRDLKHFKEKTTGHIVIMGYNTYMTLPKFPLPNRQNIVVGPDMRYDEEHNVNFVCSFPLALRTCNTEENFGKKRFVIGGGMLYQSTIDYADYLYITEFDTVVEDADTYFPEINPNDWEIIDEYIPNDFKEDEVRCKFITYARKTEKKQF